MDPHRTERVSEALREELAEIIQFEMEDPRLAGVMVSGVRVEPDMRKAHVMVALDGADEVRQSTLEALEAARNYIRRELSSRMRIFRVPELHFEEDSADSPAARVEELLKRVRKNREKELKNQQE